MTTGKPGPDNPVRWWTMLAGAVAVSGGLWWLLIAAGARALTSLGELGGTFLRLVAG